MLSEAAKAYDRVRRIKPLSKSQRNQVYSSKSVRVNKTVGQRKFSPFNTIDRTSRTSYLLRVTKEPNSQTNYNVNHHSVLSQNRRATIDKAKFQRIIGHPVPENYSIDLGTKEMPGRCIKSQTLSPQGRRPLTVRDQQNWRKTFQHFDFDRQQSTKRVKVFPKLSFDQSTNATFMETLRGTIESNFNNFERFKSSNPKPHKAHDFKSDFGHKYLKEVQDRQRSPQYDVREANEEMTRKSMIRPKGFVKFDEYREKVTTRVDRADPHWHTLLEFNPEESQKIKNPVFFDEQLDREPNSIHSKYPIRLSLEHVKKVRRA